MDRSDTGTTTAVGEAPVGVPAGHGDGGVEPGREPSTDLALDVAVLRRVLDGPHHELREQVRASHAADWFTPRRHDSADEAHRAWVTAAMHELRADTPPAARLPARAYGGRDEVGASVAAFEMLALGDLSLTVKAGVQWGLFGGAVQALGTHGATTTATCPRSWTSRCPAASP